MDNATAKKIRKSQREREDAMAELLLGIVADGVTRDTRDLYDVVVQRNPDASIRTYMDALARMVEAGFIEKQEHKPDGGSARTTYRKTFTQKGTR